MDTLTWWRTKEYPIPVNEYITIWYDGGPTMVFVDIDEVFFIYPDCVDLCAQCQPLSIPHDEVKIWFGPIPLPNIDVRGI